MENRVFWLMMTRPVVLVVIGFALAGIAIASGPIFVAVGYLGLAVVVTGTVFGSWRTWAFYRWTQGRGDFCTHCSGPMYEPLAKRDTAELRCYRCGNRSTFG